MPGQIKSYRDLIAWQKAMELVERIYGESGKLPRHEQFGLIAQIRRASVSVPSNIAEGWGRNSTRDYVRFLNMAQGSAYEIATQAEICGRLAYEGDWRAVLAMTDEVRRILHGLIRSIEAN